MTDIDTRIEITVGQVMAPPAVKRAFLSLSPLDMPAPGAGEAGVGRANHGDSKTGDRSKQQHARTKKARSMFLPTDQSFGIFQGNASARCQCYEHRLPSFAGNDLSRWTHGALPVPPLFCMVLFPFIVAVKQGPQVWPLIPVRSRDGGFCSHVAAQPALGFLHLWQGNRDSHIGVPLPVLAHDEGTTLRPDVQCGPRQGQCAIQGMMPTRRDIQFVFGALEQNPVVEAFCVLGQLQIGAINQFGMQRRRCERSAGLPRCFQGASVVDVGAAICPSDELSEPFARWARRGSALFRRLAHSECAIGVGALKEGRQERKRIRLISGGIQLQLVRKNDFLRLHTSCIAETTEKENPPQDAQTRERGTIHLERQAETAFSLPLLAIAPLWIAGSGGLP